MLALRNISRRVIITPKSIGSLSALRSFSAPATQIQIPSNLTVPSTEILVKQKPVITIEEFAFPLMPSKVPTEFGVKSFSNGEFVGNVALNKTIFEIPLRKDIILNTVRYIRNLKRQPKKTKRIGDIRGSGKKPHPQKGQGFSQSGQKRNPSRRGGMKAHGPVLRDYSIKINKKVRAKAYMMVLAAKLREGNLVVVDNFNIDQPKTSLLLNHLNKVGINESDKALLVDSELENNFKLASQNLSTLHSMDLKSVNTYEVLRREKLIITSRAFEEVQDFLIYMFTGHSKIKSYNRNLAAYLEQVEEGKKLNQQN